MIPRPYTHAVIKGRQMETFCRLEIWFIPPQHLVCNSRRIMCEIISTRQYVQYFVPMELFCAPFLTYAIVAKHPGGRETVLDSSLKPHVIKGVCEKCWFPLKFRHQLYRKGKKYFLKAVRQCPPARQRISFSYFSSSPQLPTREAHSEIKEKKFPSELLKFSPLSLSYASTKGDPTIPKVESVGEGASPPSSPFFEFRGRYSGAWA